MTEMAGIAGPGASSNSNTEGTRDYFGAPSAVQYPQPYNFNFRSMMGFPLPAAPAVEYRYDLYQNSGTQYIHGLTNQIGIVKGHGNGATVYGSFYVQ